MLITFACRHWCQNIVGSPWNFIWFWAAIRVREWFTVNVSIRWLSWCHTGFNPTCFVTSNHVSGFEEQTMSWTVLALYKRLWIALQFGVHKMYYRELALHHHQNQCNLDYLISIPGSSCQLLKHIVTCLIMNNHLQLWVRSHSWFSSSETTCSEVQQALLWQAELHHIQISICWNCRQNNRHEHSRRSTIGPANICKQQFKNHRLSFGATIGLLWNFLTSRNEKSVQ
jgi:hypothetical protein